MRLCVAAALLVSACDVGSAVPSSADAAPIDGTPQTLSVTFTTSSTGGIYDPANVVAVWIEGGGGNFVKTIGRWSMIRTGSLVAWNQKSGGDADAVSGATRTSHTTPLTVTWDLTDRQDAVVPDGGYTLRMELADSNVTQATQNNQGTFTFTKSATPETQSAPASGGFSNVTIQYTP